MLQSGTIDRVDDIACLVDGFCCWVSHCMEIDIVYIACKCDGQQTNSWNCNFPFDILLTSILTIVFFFFQEICMVDSAAYKEITHICHVPAACQC